MRALFFDYPYTVEGVGREHPGAGEEELFEFVSPDSSSTVFVIVALLLLGVFLLYFLVLGSFLFLSRHVLPLFPISELSKQQI